MSDAGEGAFKPHAYVKDGCPFSCKFLVFAAEAGFLEDIGIVRLREGTPDFDATTRKLGKHLGKRPSSPMVETEPGRYMTDSDRLIEHFAQRRHLNTDEPPVLSLYEETIFQRLLEHHKLTSGGKN